MLGNGLRKHRDRRQQGYRLPRAGRRCDRECQICLWKASSTTSSSRRAWPRISAWRLKVPKHSPKRPALKKGFEEAEEAGAEPGVEGFPSLAEQKFLEAQQYYAHTLIEGGMSNGPGNYHDYYEINVSPALPLISSRLILKGDIGKTGNGGFITNPSNCAGPGPATTNTVTLTSLWRPEGHEEIHRPRSAPKAATATRPSRPCRSCRRSR